MKKYRFFVNKNLLFDNNVYLFDNNYYKIRNILKLRIGDIVFLFNNNIEVKSIIVKYGFNYVIVKKVEKKFFKNSNLSLNLGYFISKDSHMELAIQKATELGVFCIIPLISISRNKIINVYNLKNRMLHWKRIIIESCRQSNRISIPIICYPITLYKWINYLNYLKKSINITNVILSSDLTNSIDYLKCSKYINIIIGSENGITKNELLFLQFNGFKKICLGSRILRTETAVFSGITAFQLYVGDM
ncbi:MAG: 16S rRNA (uracil(1498)-N(3))-methyltransferase [Candidatus Azosocius agrarius]|nr:MAG: 16S rRNA (uracil(1498)-N(3))-methyltransferase [Gammaproteobacteria bacterium]